MIEKIHNKKGEQFIQITCGECGKSEIFKGFLIDILPGLQKQGWGLVNEPHKCPICNRYISGRDK